jgi:hypothetical protein
MTTREKLLHPATFIALISLFIALGGVGYAATKIGTKQIRNAAVTNKKLANNSVTTRKIRTGAVANSDLANNSVSTQKVRPGAIITSDLAAGSVLNGNLGNLAVTGAKIANETIGTQKIENGAIASDKLGTGAVIASKLGASSVTTPAIAPDAITAGQIANGQVVEGNGQLFSFQATVASNAIDTPLMSFPGLGALEADCSAAGVATVGFVNTSGTSINLLLWGVVNTPVPPGEATILNTIPPNGAIIEQTAGDGGVMGITWMASLGQGSSVRLATINVSTNGVGTDCVVSVQATYAA